MCGIAGVLGRSPNELEVSNLLERIQHRGPDHQGVYVSPSARAGIGMVRLSILDLSTGNQPMFSEDRSYSFVFNGELYNYLEIKKDLEARGIVFKTRSDTEVVFQALLNLGIEKALSLFDGMFAFCLWSEKEQKAILARDRYGEKPLYYLENGKQFLFCSELHPLIQLGKTSRKIDLDQLKSYLTYQHTGGEKTLVQGVNRLLPGHWMEVQTHGGRIKVRKAAFFHPAQAAFVSEARQKVGPLEAQLQIKKILEDSIRTRLLADVPVGVFLSGGIDSSIVAYEAAKQKTEIQTFSIAFEDPRFNESQYSRLMSQAIGSKHSELIFSHSDFCQGFERLIPYLSEPLADAAAIPTALLAEHARRSVKVVLSGEGSDEIFGGYDYYFQNYPLGPVFPKMGDRSYSGFPSAFHSDELDRLFTIPLNLSESVAAESARVFVENWGNWGTPKDGRVKTQREILNLILSYDLSHWLPGDLLVKVDTTTMAHSLECRAPFLNFQLQEAVFQLGPHLRMKNDIPKYLLKLLYGTLLPQEIIFRKKQGFGLPLDQWFREGKLKNMATEAILDGPLAQSKFFNRRFLSEILSQHQNGASYERKILVLMMLSYWMQKNQVGL